MATAGPELLEAEPSENECSICSELYTEPKLLPCCHLLCRSCLLDVFKTQHAQAECPFCRTPILESAAHSPRPGSDSRWEAVVEGFPTDLAAAERAEMERLLLRCHPCCTCEGVPAPTATSICLDCGDMFCDGCRRRHPRQKVARGHSVQDLRTMTADQLSFNRPPACPDHADQPCELYCPAHEVSLCHDCASAEHRGCPGVQDLSQRAEDSRSKLALLQVVLKASEKRLGQALGHLEGHLEETKGSIRDGVSCMEEACHRLKSALDARCRQVKSEAESASNDVTRSIEQGRACLQLRRGNTSSRKRAVQRTEQATGDYVVNTMTSVMTNAAETLDCRTTLPDGARAMTSINVRVDPDLIAIIEGHIATLGQVIVSVPEDVPWEVTTSGASLLPPPSLGISLRDATDEEELRFHDNYGRNIVLSNNNRIAKRTGAMYDNGGIVMGCQPMTVNVIYQVRVDDTAGHAGWPCPVGVVTQPPGDLSVPAWSGQLKAAIVVWWDCVIVNGNRDNTVTVGEALKTVAEKDRVGVLVDDSHALHLCINGEDKGVVAPDVPFPCFSLFDVCGPYRKITALPTECIG